MKYSYSRLKLYEQCPYRFFKKYVEKASEEIALPLAFGTAAHKAIEEKIKGVPHEQAVLNGYIEADFFEGLDVNELSRLVERAPLPSPEDILIEYQFELPLDPFTSDSPILRGYIDILAKDGTYLTDWKTNRKMYHVCDNEQVGLYAWVASQLFGVKRVVGTLYFLRFNRKSTHIFTLNDMERMRLWALNLAEKVQSSVALYEAIGDVDSIFPAKPSALCKHCPFAVECYRNANQKGLCVNG